MASARHPSPPARRPNSISTSTHFGRSSKSMSRVEQVAASRASPQYQDWLRRERRGRLAVRATQLAILAVLLVLWEALPRAQVINPFLTSYPSALWPTFIDLLKATPQQPSILAHTWATVLATVIGFTMAILLGLFITILMIYSGFQGTDPNKVKLAQTFGASKGQILTKVVLPGSVPTLIAALKVNAGLSLVGVVVGEFQSANLGLGYLILYGSQILKMNIVMTAITLLAIVSSLMYLAIAWLEAAVMRRR